MYLEDDGSTSLPQVTVPLFRHHEVVDWMGWIRFSHVWVVREEAFPWIGWSCHQRSGFLEGVVKLAQFDISWCSQEVGGSL